MAMHVHADRNTLFASAVREAARVVERSADRLVGLVEVDSVMPRARPDGCSSAAKRAGSGTRRSVRERAALHANGREDAGAAQLASTASSTSRAREAVPRSW